LVAGRVVEVANAPEHVRAAVLIGVDIGPNLSVTGSLATILWLSALRRDGLSVDAWTFLKLGVLVMPPAPPCQADRAPLSIKSRPEPGWTKCAIGRPRHSRYEKVKTEKQSLWGRQGRIGEDIHEVSSH
jgi:hypothetical protein